MVLVGMHPVLTQGPPNNFRAAIATFIPAAVRRWARKCPSCPVPIMIASYALGMGGLLRDLDASGLVDIFRFFQISLAKWKSHLFRLKPQVAQSPSQALSLGSRM